MPVLATTLLLGMMAFAAQLVGPEAGIGSALASEVAQAMTVPAMSSTCLPNDASNSPIMSLARLDTATSTIGAIDLGIAIATCEDYVVAHPAVADASPPRSTVNVRSPQRKDHFASASDVAVFRFISLPSGVWLVIVAFVGLVGVARGKERS